MLCTTSEETHLKDKLLVRLRKWDAGRRLTSMNALCYMPICAVQFRCETSTNERGGPNATHSNLGPVGTSGIFSSTSCFTNKLILKVFIFVFRVPQHLIVSIIHI